MNNNDFVRLIDIDGDPVYFRKNAIKSIYVDSEKLCTVVDLFCDETFYVKGDVDCVAQKIFYF